MKPLRLLALVGLVIAAALPATAAPAASAPYQATDCYHSLWTDPNDAAGLDVASYGARYDCTAARWSFPVSTYEAWSDGDFRSFMIAVDTDSSSATGCEGFEWRLWTPTPGVLQGQLLHAPTCNPGTWTTSPNAPLLRPDGSSISISVANAALGSPTTINWWGSLWSVHDAEPDYLPDGDGVHTESGFNGPCNTLPMAAGDRPSSYLVVDHPAAAAAALRDAGLRSVTTAGEGVVRFAGDATTAARALARHGLDTGHGPITVDRRRTRAELPSDPMFSSQWGLTAVNAPAAWDRTHGSPAVVVADIDSGIDTDHPDLAGKLLPGWDAITGTPLAPGNSDSVGHGTATAGVIAAATGNGIGLAGLGWNTMLLPIKDGDQYPTISAEVAGIRHAVDRGAKVINISSGSPCPDANEAAAIADAVARGVVIVASAGNDATEGNRIQYPAAYPGVVAVGATGFDGQRAYYSHVDDYVTLVAPGGSGDGNAAHDILVLAPGGSITTKAGTSFSAPMVSAAAALVLAVAPNLNPAGVTDLLTSTATNLGTPGRDPFSGHGLLNVDAALAAAAPLRRAGLGSGYWMLTASGDVYGFGDAGYHGSAPAGAVDIEPTLTGKGYWILTAAGQIVSRGEAAPYMNVALAPGERAVSLSADPGGAGLWVFTDKGRAITRGNAPFKGDMSGVTLNGPVLGSVATPTGQGYWMVASDGGIFAFGDATFHGSTGGMRLNQPVMSMAPSDDGAGYWLVASDGGIFAFDVPFHGSMGGTPLNKPVSGMVPGPGGYLMVAEDGGIFAFGNVRFHGSFGSRPPASPVVAVALLS